MLSCSLLCEEWVRLKACRQGNTWYYLALVSWGWPGAPYVIVFYDISDDRRRTRMAKTLEALGMVRIQRSVFMGRGGQAKAKDAIRAARRIIEGSDSVVAVVVPDDYARRILVAGGVMGDPRRHRSEVRVL